MKSENDLINISNNLRIDILRTVYSNQTGHLASSLSCVDILVSLFFDNILKFNPTSPKWPDRDRFILSKGHAALALYYCLAHAGFFDKESISTFCTPGTIFGGLAVYGKIPGVEVSTGSLGHGLSFASGVALAAKRQNKNFRTYALVGEGELNEGENWEAAAFIAHQGLSNLITIIDKNDIQATGFNKNILDLDNLDHKFEAFGFEVDSINGHCFEDLKKSLSKVSNKPRVIIAHTTKGKGLSFLENHADCHYHIPTDDEFYTGMRELSSPQGGEL